MDYFARKRSAERRPIFTETAARMGINALVVEKDFWACWSLKRVFEMHEIPGHIFKGGTSLSKVYRAIRRFSEDIDISIDRSGLGFSGENDPSNASLSGKKKDRLCTELKNVCSKLIEKEILPRFQRACKDLLSDEEWEAAMDSRDPDQQSIIFRYPRSLEAYGAGAYLTPSVLLEFGCRGEQWPSENANVRPFAAEMFPQIFTDPVVTVRVLAAKRTFWEKVTLIHSENHRPASSPPRDRLSRHYSDIAAMYNTDVGKKAAEDTKLLSEVVQHKQVFFRSGWANYETAKRGSLRLVPNRELEKHLRSDYDQMTEMFFGSPEPFDNVIEAIRSLENQLNAPASGAAAASSAVAVSAAGSAGENDDASGSAGVDDLRNE